MENLIFCLVLLILYAMFTESLDKKFIKLNMQYLQKENDYLRKELSEVSIKLLELELNK